EACMSKCDDMTDKLCQSQASTCQKLDACSAQCFPDDGTGDDIDESMPMDCAGDNFTGSDSVGSGDDYGDYDDYGSHNYAGGYGDDSYYSDPAYNDGNIGGFDDCQSDMMQDYFGSSDYRVR